MDFAQWTDKCVVMQVVTNDLRFPLWGTILGEAETTVRFEVDGWYIDVEKSQITGVVEVDRQESNLEPF